MDEVIFIIASVSTSLFLKPDVLRLMSGGKKEKLIMVFRPRSLSVQREAISVRRSLSIIRNGTLFVQMVHWTRRFLHYISCDVAERRGYVCKEEEQHLDGIHIYPTHWLSPRSRFKHSPDAFGEHRVYGSWRDHKFDAEALERSFKHFCNAVRFYLLGR